MKKAVDQDTATKAERAQVKLWFRLGLPLQHKHTFSEGYQDTHKFTCDFDQPFTPGIKFRLKRLKPSGD